MIKVILLLFLSMNGCFPLLNHYLKMPKTDSSGYNIAHYDCGEGSSKPCDIEVLAGYCNSNPECQGFNTNGYLKNCTAGCQEHCCYNVTDNVDLYIRKGYLPPNDWQNDIDNGKILYANPEPHYCFLPEIGNGYIGSVSMSASLFQSGLFNGKVIREDCFFCHC